jgi:uncharacterized protein YcbX
VVGCVAELWRYPVKSMRGERVEALEITPHGASGDRAWALRDLANGKVASCKRHPALLAFRATRVRDDGPVEIEAPDGRTFGPDEPGASAIVSEILGHPMRFEREPGPAEVAGIDRATVYAGVPIEDMNVEWTAETLPEHFELRPGTYVETGALLLISSATLDHLGRLRGAPVDRRRLRPNVYVASTHGVAGFAEDAWMGRPVAIGADVVVRALSPVPWCVACTLPVDDLPRDHGVLRAIATHHGATLGVYGEVAREGTIRIGDPVALDAPAQTPAG